MAITNHHLLIQELLAKHQSNDLAYINSLIARLGIKPTYPIVLVAGTNGKGSTCGYLANILSNAGYKVGKFSSPHLFNYNERISINNQLINDSDLIDGIAYILKNSDYPLNLFSVFTLVAHIYFIRQNIDIAIIEAGIGGRLDVTNLFEPLIGAITNIALDHCDILGDSIATIALEKSGIFRPNKYAFVASQDLPNELISKLTQEQVKLQLIGKDFSYTSHELSFDVVYKDKSYYTLPYPSMRGMEQLANATLAIAIINSLQNSFPVSLHNIKKGLLDTSLIGRFNLLPGQPQIILDVAHNPSAVNIMLKNMIKLPYAKNNYAVFGLAVTKDLDSIINLCKDTFKKWYIAPLTSSNSYSNEQIYQSLISHGIAPDNIIKSQNVKDAYTKAKAQITLAERLICFGSFLLVSEIYESK